MQSKIRVLIAKPGLDGHEAGAKLVARALRNAGMEVIYTGPRQTPEMIVNAAIQESVDVLGLSLLSGAHVELCSTIIDLLRKQGETDILVILGGIIPPNDIPKLKKLGVAEIFGPGADMRKVAQFIIERVGGI